MSDAFKEWDAKFAARSQKEPERVNSDKYLVRELEKLVEELKAELGACRASPKNTSAREKRLLEKLETCQKMKRGVKKGSPKAVAAAERVAAKRASGTGKKRGKKRRSTKGKVSYSGQKRNTRKEKFGALDSLGAALRKARSAVKRTAKKATSAAASVPKAAVKAAKKASKAVTGSSGGSSKKKGVKKSGAKKSRERTTPADDTFRGGSAAQNRKAIKEVETGRRNPKTGRLYSDKKASKK